MKDHSIPLVEVENESARLRSGSGFAALEPEVQAQAFRRLGGMGLLYAFGFASTFAYYRFLAAGMGDEHHATFWTTASIVNVCVGLLVWVLCHRRIVPPTAFANAASLFQVLGGAGIYSGAVVWLDNGSRAIAQVAETLGMTGPEAVTTMVRQLHAADIRLLYLDGVTWVGVWVLAFPLIVPMPMLRTTVTTLLTAATVPVLLGVSAWITGVPEGIEPWVMPYATDATISTFICAGMAILGSRVTYRLSQDLSRARRMGNYQLEEKIGQGGMGEVWRASHRMLARPAAIKLIRPEALGGSAAAARAVLQRFEREVQHTTRLSDPHTITVFDYGRTSDGIFFYVMEYLDGLDLETFVQRFGPVPAGRAIHWLAPATRSLEEAHARGLIHRDVKPANLFACRYGVRADFVKVLDFGLVKDAPTESGVDRTRLTLDQQTLGTPAYMAPDLAMGREADPRDDLYALGCVAYWLLTGTTVFEAGTPMEVAVAHARETPIPPSERTEARVPADLEAVILACLEKDRAARPRDAADLRSRLLACEAAGSWTEADATRWWDRHFPVTDVTLDVAAAAAG